MSAGAHAGGRAGLGKHLGAGGFSRALAALGGAVEGVAVGRHAALVWERGIPRDRCRREMKVDRTYIYVCVYIAGGERGRFQLIGS